MMRNKLRILYTFTSIFTLFGCDQPNDASGDLAVAFQENEYPPHPFTSCVDYDDPSDWDPACNGCGQMTDGPIEPGFASCNIECNDPSDCLAWDPGGTEVTCVDGFDGGICMWRCDDAHPCPSELECIDKQTLEQDWGIVEWANTTSLGLCFAPGVAPSTLP
jgi:hypothetical protein